MNAKAEALRTKLLQSSLSIPIQDLGAGSVIKGEQRLVKEIARYSLSSKEFSALYARVIQFYQCQHVIELGTSLGINALYLAGSVPNFCTFEGAPALVNLARDTFNFAQAGNIKLVEGNIDETLPAYCSSHPKIDFAFVDANHQYEAVMRYFALLLKASHEKTILVFDDIYLNAEMEKAWRAIQNHSLVYATADLFRCGFVFLDPSLNRIHKVLRF